MSDENNVLNQDDIDSLLDEANIDDDASEEEEQKALKTEGSESETESKEEKPREESDSGEDGKKEDAPDDNSDSVPAPDNFGPETKTLSLDASRELEFLLDIPLQLRVEVGRAKVSIAHLLSYGPGAVVELNKLAGEPLDIFVNNKLIARGEAVVVNEKFGIRLTDVVSKSERLEHLN